MKWSTRSRIIGVDDGPFPRRRGVRVPVVGILMSGAIRVEGVLSTWVARDGWNATNRLVEMLTTGRLGGQAQAVLLDGIALGGLNIVDLPLLADSVGVPAIAVMRRSPDLEKFAKAIERVSRPERRKSVLRRAGPIHPFDGGWFQAAGCDTEEARTILRVACFDGSYPEALRVAHLVARGVTWGASRGGA